MSFETAMAKLRAGISRDFDGKALKQWMVTSVLGDHPDETSLFFASAGENYIPPNYGLCDLMAG